MLLFVMDKEYIYNLLEEKLLTYKELLGVFVQENHESMVSLKKAGAEIFFLGQDMDIYTGKDMYVRESLVSRFNVAQTCLSETLPDYHLEVIYGYRHPDIQKKFYENVKKNMGLNGDSIDVKEAVHRFVAVPEVAGHPTGGAIDLRIIDQKGNPLDMGTDIHELVKDSYVFSPFISKAAWDNRQMLRDFMKQAGFAPFDGEWWHFSYGDREWASYYRKPNAFYSKIDFSVQP